MLILETLAEHIHVQHAQEATTEATPQSRARLVGKFNATIRQTQLCESFLEIFVVIRVLRVDSGKNNSLRCLIARKWLNFIAI